ncbi:MAG: HlyC/CorC family transporter [Parachlamydiaceae bacterium]|nr:HlyC/CorC family transporter [Parachlamydiaceae bacterium]
MLLISLFFLTFFFLSGTFLLTALSTAFRRLHKQESKKQQMVVERFFLYSTLHRMFFPTREFEGIFFATICAQNVTRFCYALFAYLFLSHTNLFYEASQHGEFTNFWIGISLLAFLVLGFIFGDFLPRIFGTKMSDTAIRLCAPPATLFLFLSFPLAFFFLKLSHSLSQTIYFDHFQEPTTQAQQEIIEIVQRSELSPGISHHDKQLIESVLNFRDRVVREVMVPRVNVFSLPAETTIKDAVQRLYDEGYSRTPIYKGTVDNIVGILMYKDVLKKYMEYKDKGNDLKILEISVESISKPPIYTPETKKISNLLQEFRKQQVHLAIVVDEYGGTEGLVTIEDILEAIVGNIADEYDEEEPLFKECADHTWIVDAKLNILDAEEHLGIEIPQEGDYDTIGGYIYHCTGAIPSKGFTIHNDTFDMEILSSNERSVDKVRIIPRLEED